VKKIFILFVFLYGCGGQQAPQNLTGSRLVADCKRMPSYVAAAGFPANSMAFSTSEKRTKGLVLVDIAKSDSAKNRTWQHPSWKTAGSMGPIAVNELGEVFAAPVPSINVLDNPIAQQNTIYRVNAASGELQPFLELPKVLDPIAAENPFGILGMVYDCESKTLYASTVYGSTKEKEVGKIYAIDFKGTEPATNSHFSNTDAMGVGIAYLNEEKRLFYGSTRDSKIYSVQLDEQGNFKGSSRIEIDMNGQGPRGDDRARKIRFDKNGQMIVQAVEFFYNLIAPTEKQESVYTYKYNLEKQQWDLQGVNSGPVSLGF
jgi:hypothetical protein